MLQLYLFYQLFFFNGGEGLVSVTNPPQRSFIVGWLTESSLEGLSLKLPQAMPILLNRLTL